MLQDTNRIHHGSNDQYIGEKTGPQPYLSSSYRRQMKYGILGPTPVEMSHVLLSASYVCQELINESVTSYGGSWYSQMWLVALASRTHP